MSSLSIRQVANYRPLTRCGLEELAAHQINAKPSGGVLFARKTEHANKDLARQAVVDLFTLAAYPNLLSILTMPGLEWHFENALLAMREGDEWLNHKFSRLTRLSCIENDRSVYHGGIMQMPGMQNRVRSLIKVLPARAHAERVVRNDWISRFYFGNVDDLIATRAGKAPYDAAWLDYTGPLSQQRLARIKEFFRTSIKSVLVVTALRARWNRETSDAIDRCHGHSQWFRKSIHGDVLHDIDYQDGPSPMMQIAISKGSA